MKKGVKKGVRDGIETIFSTIAATGLSVLFYRYAESHWVFVVWLHINIFVIFMTFINWYLGGWDVE